MKTDLVELNVSEIREISGGGLYEIGISVGRYCADCVDFYHGIFDGMLF